jgi:hypothetical protein
MAAMRKPHCSIDRHGKRQQRAVSADHRFAEPLVFQASALNPQRAIAMTVLFVVAIPTA